MANAFAAMNGLYLEDLKVGMSAMFGKTITEADILLYAAVSTDTNPVHVHDAEAAKQSVFGERIAHGMLSAGLISVGAGHAAPRNKETLYMAPVTCVSPPP